MLARRPTTILPALNLAEALETMCIHSLASLTGDRTALVTTRPVRSLRHAIWDAGLRAQGPTLNVPPARPSTSAPVAA
jgi:predicted ATPase with chaperone activity